MRIPSSIVVLSVRIAIETHDPKYDKDLRDCYGYYDPTKLKIVLRNDLGKEMRRAIVAHEIAHAYVHHSGFGYTMLKLVEQEESREFLEEQMIRAVIVPYVLSSFRWLNK